jgi:filamentous hemagglutinin family protein
MVPKLGMAQIIPDNSLGAENSLVKLEDKRNLIEGGATRGNNLFHSFEKFEIKSDLQVYFNPDLGIENIIARVTGQIPSNIEGTLGIIGNANLFFLNPAGIIFGSQARLDLQGSFLATTADRILFENGFAFSAEKPEIPPLLTVKIPMGLQLGNSLGSIVNYSQTVDPSRNFAYDDNIVGLQVRAGKTLSLVGGDIKFIGGQLTVSNGNIEVGSVGKNSRVKILETSTGFSLDYQQVENFGDLTLEDLASINASGSGGGAIQVRARNLKLSAGSQIISYTFDADDGKSLSIDAEAIELIGAANNNVLDLFFLKVPQLKIPLQSSISTTTFGAGKGGNLTIATKKLTIRDGAELTAESLGLGQGGDLLVKAQESIELRGATDIPLEQNVNPNIIPSLLNEEVLLEINVTSTISTSSSIFGGKTGNMRLETGSLRVTNGGIVTTNPFGSEVGGNLDIAAKEAIDVMGTSNSGLIPSLIASTGFGLGNSGDINIQTRTLKVGGGGSIASSTLASGKGGNLNIVATEKVELADRVSLAELRTFSIWAGSGDRGNGGNLFLTTDRLIIKNRGTLAVSSTSQGGTGNLLVRARSLELKYGSIIAESQFGNGGNINLEIERLILLRDRSSISTTAGKMERLLESTNEIGGNGGNINIDTNFIVALAQQSNRISANAFLGNGGNININAKGLFGISDRPENPEFSSITASSELGIDGEIVINLPAFNLNKDLLILPSNTFDASQFIVQNCLNQKNDSTRLSKFTISGRGGVPANPERLLIDDITLDNWLTIDSQEIVQQNYLESIPPASGMRPETIVEARKAISRNGKVFFVAEPSISFLNSKEKTDCSSNQLSKLETTETVVSHTIN